MVVSPAKRIGAVIKLSGGCQVVTKLALLPDQSHSRRGLVAGGSAKSRHGYVRPWRGGRQDSAQRLVGLFKDFV